MTAQKHSKSRAKYHHGDLVQAVTSAAVELINTRGEAHFSLREIAASISVSHAAVYRHFTNKRAVLAAVAEDGYQKLIEILAGSELPEGANIHDRLRLQFTNYVQFALKHPGHYRAMFHHELSEKQDLPALDKIATEAGALLLANAQKALAEHPNRSESVESLALGFWAMAHGFAELTLNRQFPSARTKDPDVMAQRIHEVTEILLSGLV